MARTLLLADDSVTVQRVVELTFADEDIRVVSVSDGDAAIASIEAEAPDIVLADIGMPGRNGYEVARHIKESPKLARIPVVLLAGAFDPVDHAKAAAVGSDAVLAKPFEPQLVIARVRELLAAAEDSADSSAQAPPRTPDAARLDTYFEELDAAFATLPAASSTRPATSPVPEPSSPTSDDTRSDGFSLPPLADAFAALLATEHHLPGPPPTWPPAASGGAPPSDELVEAVTRRVLARLSETVVRETVSEVVASVAERLVREEIERIKASIT